MRSEDFAIARYYRRLDKLEAGDPLELIAEEFAFAIHVPGGDLFAGGTDELRGYMAQRGPGAIGRVHNILHATMDDSLEVVYGEVVEHEETRTGSFIAAAESNSDGLITRYVVAFTPGLLFPAASRLREMNVKQAP